MLESSNLSASHSGVGALAQHGWIFTERIMNSNNGIQVKLTAVHFYLNVCGFDAAQGVDSCMSTLPILSEYVEKVIQRVFQSFGNTLRQSEKFGCDISDLIDRELMVSNQ